MKLAVLAFLSFWGFLKSFFDTSLGRISANGCVFQDGYKQSFQNMKITVNQNLAHKLKFNKLECIDMFVIVMFPSDSLCGFGFVLIQVHVTRFLDWLISLHTVRYYITNTVHDFFLNYKVGTVGRSGIFVFQVKFNFLILTLSYQFY